MAAGLATAAAGGGATAGAGCCRADAGADAGAGAGAVLAMPRRCWEALALLEDLNAMISDNETSVDV